MENVKTISTNLDELKTVFEDMNFKFVRLLDNTRKVLVNWNNAKPEPTWDKIFKLLNSKSSPIGNYILEFKIQQAKPATEYIFQKGNGLSANGGPQIIYKEVEKNSAVLTFEQAIAYEREIADLKSQLRQAELERDDWQRKYEEIPEEEEETEEEEQKPLGDQKPAWLSSIENIVPGIMSGWEKHLELKEKALNLEQQKLQQYGMPVIKRQAPQQQSTVPPEVIEKINEFIADENQLSTAEYDKIIASANGATSIEQILKTWSQVLPDSYAKLLDYLNLGEEQ